MLHEPLVDEKLADAKLKIKFYLEDSLLVDFDEDIDEDSDLFRLGLIDSYGYIEVMRFIESAFAVTFEDEELLLEIETSLRGLADLAVRKQAQKGDD